MMWGEEFRKQASLERLIWCFDEHWLLSVDVSHPLDGALWWCLTAVK